MVNKCLKSVHRKSFYKLGRVLRMYSGRGYMGQEWSGVVSAQVLMVYMTLQGRLHTLHLTTQKLKVI